MFLRPIVVGLRAAGVAGLILYSSMSSAAALRMNGLAEYESLGETVFVAALQAQTPKNTAFDLANDALPARMEYRFLKEGYRKRTFHGLLKEAVVSNNDPQVIDSLLTPGGALEKILNVGGSLQTFTTGDIITIDYDGTNTTAAFNGAVFVSERGKDIFNVILNTWVGSAPPSARFKGEILTMGSGALFDQTKEMYSILIPTEARKAESIAAVGATRQINPVDASTQVVYAIGKAPADTAVATVAAPPAAAPSSIPEPVATPEPKPEPVVVAVTDRPDRPDFLDTKPAPVAAPVEPQQKPADKPVVVAATKPAAKPAEKPSTQKPTTTVVAAATPKPAASAPPQTAKPAARPAPEPVVVAAVAPPRPVVNEAAIAAKQAEYKYRQLVKLAVTRKIEYPEKAVEMSWEDTVVLALVVAPDGSIKSADYNKKSQYEPLNKAAMRAAMAAKIPADGSIKNNVEVLVPVRFTLASS